MKIFILILSFVLCVLSGGVMGAWGGVIYHVDATGGDDLNNGLSMTNAWKTISKVNASTFSNGDSILFKKGGIWREQLIIPSSGSKDNLITFGAYGSGEPPVISGADIVETWTMYTVAGGGVTNIYFASLDWVTEDVFEDTVRLKKVPWSGNIETTITVMSAGSWTFDESSKILYVWSSNNTDPKTHKMEVSKRSHGIYGWHKIYIKILGIKCINSNKEGIYNLGGNNWTVDGVDSSYNAGGGIRNFGEDIYNNINSLVIINSVASYNGDTGIYAGNYGDMGTIDRNIVHHNCLNKAYDFNAGIKIWGPSSLSNYTITHNTVYNNGTFPPSLVRGVGIWSDNTNGGHIISYNHVYNNGYYGIYMEKESVANIISYNIIHDEATITDAYSGSGITLMDNIKNQHIYNNIIYRCRIGILALGKLPLSVNACSNNIVKNNIIYGSTFLSLAVNAGCENDGIHGSGNVFEYNALGSEYSNFIEWSFGHYKSTYAEWEMAYGRVTHSVRSNPLMIDPSQNNFRLQTGSPCLDKGSNVSQTLDYEGNKVPVGLAPDIGAFEYQGIRIPSPPSNLLIQ